MWVKKFYPLQFSEIFPKWLRIFNQNCTCLLHVHIYAKLQNFIQLSPTLTKLCHIQWIFTYHNACVQTNAHQIHPTSTHLTTICGVQCFRYFTNFTLKAKDHSRAKKCTAADLGWLAADNDQHSYQRVSQTSDRMHFGRWSTFWAYDVNFVQKYFNLTVCCFIKCKKNLF